MNQINRLLAEIRSAKKGFLLGLLLLLILAAPISAQVGGGYDLSWWEVGGGIGTSSGGNYTLSGSVGQPEVATLRDSDGTYTLVGGFWGIGDSGDNPGAGDHKLFLPIIVNHP
jgi:hypothetical protein